MANAADDMDAEHAESRGAATLVRFGEDTFRQRPRGSG